MDKETPLNRHSHDSQGQCLQFINLLKKVSNDISSGNLENFEVSCGQWSTFALTEPDTPSSQLWNQPDNPFLTTNVIILACKKNRYQLLDFLLDPKFNDVVLKFHERFCPDAIDPNYEDIFKHNAFYYAIRSNCTKMLNVLIDRWPRRNLRDEPNILAELLAGPYEELRLRKIEISPDMDFCVESSVIGSRFFFSRQQIMTPAAEISARFDFLISLIGRWLDYEPLVEDGGPLYTYNLQLIAVNIHALKCMVKPSYDSIPWEEMEFCIVIHLQSREHRSGFFSCFYQTLISTAVLKKHLRDFHSCLQTQISIFGDSAMNQENEIPSVERSKLIEGIMEKYPAFEYLYNDFEICRDLKSLEMIKKYIDSARLADPKIKRGQRVIDRVLHVINEYLENSVESPKMSASRSREIVQTIQNFTPCTALSERIVAVKDDQFFVDAKHDLNLINEIIIGQLQDMIMKIVESTLDLLSRSEDPQEVKYIVEPYSMEDFELMNNLLSVSSLLEIGDSITELIAELCEIVGERKDAESGYYSNIQKAFSSCSQTSKPNNWFKAYIELRNIGKQVFYYSAEKAQWKERIKRTLLDLNKTTLDASAMDSLSLALSFLRMLLNMKNKEHARKASLLLLKINNYIEFGTRNPIEEILRTLVLRAPKMDHQPKIRSDIKSVGNNGLHTELIIELNEVLSSRGISFKENTIVPESEHNFELHVILESLISEIMSSLKNLNKTDSQQSCENISLSLLGEGMTNYPHLGNEILEIITRHPSRLLILKAELLATLDFDHFDINSVSIPSTNILKKDDEMNRNIVIQQAYLLESLKNGHLGAVEKCFETGADIAAKSVDSMSVIHVAAMTSEDCLKYILDIWDGPTDVKDAHGQTPLHMAAISGSVNFMESLLESKNFDINAVDYNGRTVLHVVAAAGHQPNVVKMLLDRGGDPSRTDISGRLPLHYAILEGDLETSKILISSMGKELTISPLYAAACAGSTKIVEYLLSCGNDVNVLTTGYKSPLVVTSHRSRVDVHRILTTRRAHVDAESNNMTPLHAAVEIKNEEMVQLLLRAGADPNIGSTDDGLTPIFQATIDGSVKLVRILLEWGAKANVLGVEGWNTPLHWAAFVGYSEVIRMLIKMNGDVRKQNESGSTPLHLCVLSGHFNAAKLLITHGAPINTKDKSGRTPIFLAALCGFTDLTELLLSKNASINIYDLTGKTPLHLACSSGQAGVVKILIDHGSDINAVSAETSCTPLAFAAKGGHVEIVKLLLAHDADMNIIDSSGFMAVHQATILGHTEIVSLLITKDPKQLNALNSIGCAPLHLACCNGWYKIAALLIQHGGKLDQRSNYGLPLDYALANKMNVRIVELLLIQNSPVYESHVKEAVESGFAEVIGILLDHLPNPSDNLKAKLLLTAVVALQISSIRALVIRGVDTNQMIVGPSGTATLLHFAAAQEHEGILRVLLENGADPNKKCMSGTLPLHLVACRGNLTMASDLLAYGAKTDIADSERITPLEVAVRNGKIDIFNLFLEHDPTIDINGISKYKGSSLLHFAAASASLDMVKILVQKGASVHIRDSDGNKPVHLAAIYGVVEIVNFLLLEGIDVREVGENGNNLLHFTAIGSNQVNDNSSIFKYLIVDKHLDPNLTNLDGNTPLHIAARKSLHLSTIKVLLENGACYSIKNLALATPLDLARNPMVAFMFSSMHGLFNFIELGYIPGIQKALADNVLVDVINIKKETPLILATQKGSIEIVNVLLAKNANPNYTGDRGMSPLHYACKHSNDNIVLSLLAHGAIFNLEDDAKKKPVDYADKGTEAHSICAFIEEMFESVQRNDMDMMIKIVFSNDLSTKKKNIPLLNCRNKCGKSLMALAILIRPSIEEQLKNLFTDSERRSIFNDLFVYGIQKCIPNLCYSHMKNSLFSGYQRHSLMMVELDISVVKVLRQNCFRREAIKIMHEVCETLVETLGDDNWMTMRLKYMLAEILFEESLYKEAFEVLQNLLKLECEILESTDTDLINTQILIASVLDGLGRYDEALEISNQVFEKRQALLGAEHPFFLAIQERMAKLTFKIGKYEEALELYLRVYKARLNASNPHHYLVLKTENHIAEVRLLLTRKKEALAENEKKLRAAVGSFLRSPDLKNFNDFINCVRIKSNSSV